MTENRNALRSDLAEQIAELCAVLMDADRDTVEAAIDEVGDWADADGTDQAALDSILDGIRWGHRAAIVVERHGGTILRLRTPGGVAVTHEWAGTPGDDDLRRALANARHMQKTEPPA